MALILGVVTAIFMQERTPNRLKINQLNMHATVFNPVKTIQPFSLVFHNESTFTEQDLKGKWTWLFFGYTFCPDICPTTMTVLSKVFQLLEAQANIALPQVIFVSVDPKRDTLEQLAKYVNYFHSKFKAATGSNTAITQLTSQLGILHYQLPKEPEKDYYLVDHSAAILLINPDGQLQAMHGTPHQVDQLVEDLTKIQQAWR